MYVLKCRKKKYIIIIFFKDICKCTTCSLHLSCSCNASMNILMFAVIMTNVTQFVRLQSILFKRTGVQRSIYNIIIKNTFISNCIKIIA